MYHILVLMLKISIGWRFKITVSGKDNLPIKGPAIIVFNHSDALDTISIMFSIPRPLIAFMARKYRNIPLVVPFRLTGNVVLVRRGEQDRTALETAVNHLNQGKWLVIAPEGTRGLKNGSTDSQPIGSHKPLQKGKYGTAYIALMAGKEKSIPIVPVGIVGATGALQRLFSLRFWDKIEISVVIGKPFTLDQSQIVDDPNLDNDELRTGLDRLVNEQIMSRIAILLPAEMRGPFR